MDWGKINTIIGFLDWSTIIGSVITGVLALVGIGWGIAGTARANRKERKETRRQERDGLRAALIGELRQLSRTYTLRARVIELAGAEGVPYFNVPRREETEVYDKLLDKIVLLNVDQVEKVVHAYASAKHLLPNLERIEIELKAPALEGQDAPGYIRVRQANFAKACELHHTRVPIFDEAIGALEITEGD